MVLTQRILIALAIIIAVAAAAASATGAFFSDTETSTGNTFTAGDIDLTIDNESYVTNNLGQLVASAANSWAANNLTNQLFFSFGDVKPGDVGEDTISVHGGTNDAFVCMAADITATPDNGINEPEAGAGDVTDGAQGGELQNYLNFMFWQDDGDNVYETGESQITALTGAAGTVFQGAWSQVGTSTVPGNATRYVAKAWCVGTLTPAAIAQDGLGKTGTNGPLVRGTGITCSGAGDQNLAQTDGVVIDVSFQAVQARNNGQFSCGSLPAFVGSSGITEVPQASLAVVDDKLAAYNANKWFFYNDTNDTIMSIDQFSGTGGQDRMESVLGSVGAKMVLDNGTQLPNYGDSGDLGNPRYNIATYKYKGVKLSTISALKYRVLDATSDSDTPYLHFNVDFNGSDTWQGRLVQVAAPLTLNTWTTVDAMAGTWTKTSGNWPAGLTSNGSLTGSTARTWAQIIADYPNAKTRTTDSFLGIRVGQPGPTGATGVVDSLQFGAEQNDFVL